VVTAPTGVDREPPDHAEPDTDEDRDRVQTGSSSNESGHLPPAAADASDELIAEAGVDRLDGGDRVAVVAVQDGLEQVERGSGDDRAGERDDGPAPEKRERGRSRGDRHEHADGDDDVREGVDRVRPDEPASALDGADHTRLVDDDCGRREREHRADEEQDS